MKILTVAIITSTLMISPGVIKHYTGKSPEPLNTKSQTEKDAVDKTQILKDTLGVDGANKVADPNINNDGKFKETIITISNILKADYLSRMGVHQDEFYNVELDVYPDGSIDRLDLLTVIDWADDHLEDIERNLIGRIFQNDLDQNGQFTLSEVLIIIDNMFEVFQSQVADETHTRYDFDGDGFVSYMDVMAFVHAMSYLMKPDEFEFLVNSLKK